MPIDVLVVNLAVLFAVLEADLGRRKISSFRILRPMLMATAVIPLFIKHPATAGRGEVLEIVLTGLGVVLGIAAAGGLMKISFNDGKQSAPPAWPTGRSGASSSEPGSIFTYGANHWYSNRIRVVPGVRDRPRLASAVASSSTVVKRLRSADSRPAPTRCRRVPRPSRQASGTR
jgi:hypothetical protein